MIDHYKPQARHTAPAAVERMIGRYASARVDPLRPVLGNNQPAVG